MEWKVSDILTILIIAGGVFTFGFSACKDRELKRQEHADKVRGAAAQVLGKTQALRDSIPIAILEAKSHVVVRKVNLLENYDTKKEMHTLWGNVLDSESRALQRLASLQIDPNASTVDSGWSC